MPAELVTSSAFLEREPFLAALDEWLAETVEGRGRLVFIAGEAGIGKTALVRRFTDAHESAARVLCGACESLHTPRPLGPLLDIAAVTGGPLHEITDRGDKPHMVFAALLEELRACTTPRSPTVSSSPGGRSTTTSRRSCASWTFVRGARRAP